MDLRLALLFKAASVWGGHQGCEMVEIEMPRHTQAIIVKDELQLMLDVIQYIKDEASNKGSYATLSTLPNVCDFKLDKMLSDEFEIVLY